jgi:hypothetical protein
MRQHLRQLENDLDRELERALEEMKNPKTKQLGETRLYLVQDRHLTLDALKRHSEQSDKQRQRASKHKKR